MEDQIILYNVSIRASLDDCLLLSSDYLSLSISYFSQMETIVFRMLKYLDVGFHFLNKFLFNLFLIYISGANIGPSISDVGWELYFFYIGFQLKSHS